LPLEVGVKWRRKSRSRPAPTAARIERERSAARLREAMALVHELYRIREENHFAESLRKLAKGEK
jgi:hypothetical protein